MWARGMEAWQRFHAEYEPPLRGRFQSIFHGMLAARFGTVSLQHVSSGRGKFGREFAKYKDQLKSKISEDVKAEIPIARMMEVELKEHLEINAAKLGTYGKRDGRGHGVFDGKVEVVERDRGG